MKHTLLLTLTLAATTGLYAQTNNRRAPSITARRTPGTTAAAAPAAATTSTTEVAQQLAKAEKGKGGRPKLKFDNAPAELFLQIYAQVTKRTPLVSPDVPKVTMSLRSNDEEAWSDEEYLQAIETQLQLNGIGLIPVGDKFVLVVPFKTIGQQGIETFLELPPAGHHPEEGRIVRQVLTPKNISAEEAQKAIETFKRADGQIQYLERTNSLLITDTQENVNRMIDIINFIDKPLPVMEEVQVRSLKYAKADDIKKALEEFVEASQKQDETAKKSTAAPKNSNSLSGGMVQGRSVNRSLPGVTRATTPEPAATSVADALVNDADRGMIRGKVQIMSDARSNQLIIVTRPANMQFFDRIINVLDIETAPEIAVEIIRLRYAQAETKDSVKGVSDLLNELIDASTSKDDKTAKTGGAGANVNLTQEAPATSPAAQRVSAAMPTGTKSKIGQLSKDNIKILPDPRINALMVMASPADMAAIKEIIAAMDIQVAQVLIETVVLEVSLKDNLKTGIDWIKRANSGDGNYRDVASGGAYSVADNLQKPVNLYDTAAASAASAYSGGAAYYATFKKLNLDMVINAAADDTRTKVITSPILMTQDNKEATIESTKLAFMFNGLKYTGSSSSTSNSSDYTADIKQEDVGLTVKVTPHINPDGTVVLSVDETYQDIDKAAYHDATMDQDYDGKSTRKITADISVDNGKTIVIGGLVKNTKTLTKSGIPFLRDIPYVGPYLFGSTSDSDERSELLIFLTPYVFNNSNEAQDEAARRKDYLNAAGVWNRGWSKSEIADTVNEVDKLKRDNLQRAYDDKQFEAKQKRIKADREHDEELMDRLERSIERKQRILREERKTMRPKEIESREAEIKNEQEMYDAMNRATQAEAPAAQPAAEPEPGLLSGIEE